MNPSDSTTSSIPCRPRWPTTCSIIGRWTIGSICFGRAFVSGRSRVPKPPTSTTARTSTCRGRRGGRRLVRGRRVGAALAGRRRGPAGPVALALPGDRGRGGVVGRAQLGEPVGGRRLRDVGRALGDEGDRVALAVLPEADVAEVPPDQRRLVVGGLDVLPLGDDELGVLAVA